MKDFIENNKQSIKWLVLILWSCLSIYTAFHHEIWRDEMRALSLAIQHSTLTQLYHNLTNEGHPILWYLILKGFYSFYSDTVILKLVSFIIGFSSVALFLFHIRVSLPIAILFCFSNIMMWENTISCRNYGIAALLIMLFSIFYDRHKYFLASLMLVLLAQSNLIGLLVAMMLMGYMQIRFYQNRIFTILGSMVYPLMVLFSMWFFYITTKPNELSLVVPFSEKNLATLLNHFVQSIFYPSKVLHPFIPDLPIVSALIIYMLTFYFSKDKWLAFIFYMSVVLLNFLCLEFNMISTRHTGVFLVFLFFLIHQYNDSQIEGNRLTEWAFKLGKNILLPLMCISLFISNLIFCYRDVTTKMSNSKELGEFISSHPRYKDAIIIGESDYTLEGIPYYVRNKFYIPREKRFGNYTHFTRENAREISMSEIIKNCDSLTSIDGKICLFVASQPIAFGIDQKIKIPYYVEKYFTIRKEDFYRLRKIAEFKDAYYKDENFTLYEIQ